MKQWRNILSWDLLHYDFHIDQSDVQVGDIITLTGVDETDHTEFAITLRKYFIGERATVIYSKPDEGFIEVKWITSDRLISIMEIGNQDVNTEVSNKSQINKHEDVFTVERPITASVKRSWDILHYDVPELSDTVTFRLTQNYTDFGHTYYSEPRWVDGELPDVSLDEFLVYNDIKSEEDMDELVLESLVKEWIDDNESDIVEGNTDYGDMEHGDSELDDSSYESMEVHIPAGFQSWVEFHTFLKAYLRRKAEVINV